MNIEKCKIIEIPNVTESRGKLNFLEIEQHVPFEIKRIFYITDVPVNIFRGEHAHIINHQLIICIKGSIDIMVDDGKNSKTYILNNSNQGLYIPPMIWSRQSYNNQDTISLVLASEKYEKIDYLRSYENFRNMSISSKI